jgi:Rad3-related DNA helicase
LEAHKIQEECREMEKEEKIAWINARSAKIETALKKLRHKQEQELKALILRNTISLE